MNQLDVYYRALLEYRKYTLASRECTALRSAMANADNERDKIVVQRAICTIDSDWVEAIERGLVHIEKAIKEERQFIRSNGEVVPIEKVRNVSRESVEHLAKHSSLITRYEEGEDIVPDKLYTVERLSDYAVYENRFLYMLLCYLRDFITIRHNKILDLTNKYEGRLEMTKNIVNGKQKLKYTVTLHDERRDDPYLSEHNPAKDIIDRISLVLKAVLAFLSTPLMEAVSKVAMIKPPITKTNELKMNNNFKGAVALYDFIIAYDKPGYTVENKLTTLSPFKEEVADEIAEAGSLISFLTYEHGLGIKAELKDAYLKEEDRLAREKINERREKIKMLERRLRAQEISIEDYTIELEKQLRAYEGEIAKFEVVEEELRAAKKTIRQKDSEISDLSGEIDRLEERIENINKAHFDEIEELNAAHKEAMHELIEKHEAQIAALKAEHSERVERIKSDHAAEVKALEADIDTAKAAASEAKRQAAAHIAEKDKELSALTEEYRALTEARDLSEARIKALGGITENYTDKASFSVLEREYEAFTKIYKQQWALAKKKIRKDMLDVKKIKEQLEKDKNSD